MRRFYFDLQGQRNVIDQQGLLYDSEIVAFRAGQKLAADLANARPQV